MKFVKAAAIVLGFVYNPAPFFANAADMIQEEQEDDQVASVSIESRQTSLMHIFYICILHLVQMFISIR